MDTSPNLRPVTADEVRAIMAHNSFAPPPNIAQNAWEVAKTEVLGAINQLGDAFNFPVAGGKKLHIGRTVCKPIDKAVKEQTDINQDLLKDIVIQLMRQEIGFRIVIRTRIGGHVQFENLLGLLRQNAGILDNTRNDETKLVHVTMNSIVHTLEEGRRDFGWSLILDFLTQQVGVDVKMEKKKIYKTRGGKAIIVDEPGEEPSSDLPMPKHLASYVRSVEKKRKQFIKRIEEYIEALEKEMSTLDREGESSASEIADLDGKIKKLEEVLAPAEEAKKEIEKIYQKAIKALKEMASLGKEPDDEPSEELKVPKNIQVSREHALRRIESKYAGQFAELRKLKIQLHSLRNQESKEQKKTWLKSEIKRMKKLLEQVDGETDSFGTSPSPTKAAGASGEKIIPGAKINTVDGLENFVGQDVELKVTLANQIIVKALLKRTVQIGETLSFRVGKASGRLNIRPSDNPSSNPWDMSSVENIEKANLFAPKQED